MRLRTRRKSRSKRIIQVFAAVLLDIILALSVVAGDYIYNYKIPQKLSSTGVQTTVTGQSGQSSESPLFSFRKLGQTSALSWSEKFKDHFSDTVISTDSVYKSKNISIEITKNSYDSQTIDHSDNGKHTKYGSNISYVLADIYVSDISCLQTAFAQDTYGTGYSESLTAMSKKMKSVLAVNGDSYSNNRHANNGTIIRNGTVYRTQPSTEETCVLYRDGTMKIYGPDQFDSNQAIRDGAWQSWVFGPGLLDENGNAKTDFVTWDYIRQSHPRTAVGYYEPGHYCLLVVDGRSAGYSRGMYLEEMSKLFAELGCRAAYNLDGGHCSFMTKGISFVNNPYKANKDISDGIFICEPGAVQ